MVLRHLPKVTGSERDMDILFLRYMSQEDSFLLKMFLDEIGYLDKKASVVDLQNSVHSIANDKDGESDIEVILQDENGHKFALLIEDKINAMSIDELEKLVQDVMKKELNAIINLGALIGFILGLLNLLF